MDCATAAKWGSDEHEEIHLTIGVAAKTGMCLNDRVYYLVGATGKLDCQTPDVACSNVDFSMLPGTDKLDGTKWGGITRGDIIQGYVRFITKSMPITLFLTNDNGDTYRSMNSYVFNGNKNGLKQSDERLVAGSNLNTMVSFLLLSRHLHSFFPLLHPVCFSRYLTNLTAVSRST